MKTIYVKTANWHKVIQLDENLFENVFVEACTQAIELKSSETLPGEDLLVNAVMYCTDLFSKKKSDQDKVINTYKILINAGKHDRAELLRNVFIQRMKVDLKNEPIINSPTIKKNGKRKHTK